MGYTEFYNFLIPLYGLSLGMSAGAIGMLAARLVGNLLPSYPRYIYLPGVRSCDGADLPLESRRNFQYLGCLILAISRAFDKG